MFGAAKVARTLIFTPQGLGQLIEPRRDEGPCALVLGLLLAPYDLSVGKAPQLFGEGAEGERIELLDPQHDNISSVVLFTLFPEVVIDFAGTQHDTFDFLIVVNWAVIP